MTEWLAGRSHALLAVLAGLLGVALLAAGLSTGYGTTLLPGDESAESQPMLRYVALGDSFTVAPLVPQNDATHPCGRSSGNYPHRVAEGLEAAGYTVELVDVSCGGARTAHVLQPQPTPLGQPQPPQAAPLDADTDLVTVSLGINDGGLFVRVVRNCALLGQVDPEGKPCQRRHNDSGQIYARLAEMERNLTEALEAIRQRAPQARIVVVTYPQVLDPADPCPAYPVAEGDRAFVAGVVEDLAEAMISAARTAGVEYVDVPAASQGHEICSGDPWANGTVTTRDGGKTFHPTPEGQAGIADLLLDQLTGG